MIWNRMKELYEEPSTGVLPEREKFDSPEKVIGAAVVIALIIGLAGGVVAQAFGLW